MYAFGSSAVACGAARYVTASMNVGPSPARARSTRLARRLVARRARRAPSTRSAGHPVAGRLVGERLGRGLRLDRRRDRPAVVVAEEDQRRAHHGREVRALVERALGGRAVAEVGDRARRPRRAAACPTRARPRAGRASRSARRSTRRSSRPGSTSRPDGRATTRAPSPAACRAAARSPTRGSSGRSSPRGRARTPSRPAWPRGSSRSRTSRCAPGGGRRPSARRRSAAGRGRGRARGGRARRGRRPRDRRRPRRRRSPGGARAPLAPCCAIAAGI